MSDKFWQRLSYIAGLMAIGVLFGLTAFSASLEIKDLDLWLHLGMGRYIAHNGYVPTHDVLSCTIAGKPWVNHEWLFQLLVYHIHQWWGFNGLIAMQMGVVCLTFVILLLLCYRDDRQWQLIFLLLLVMVVYQTRFTIRPDIFSLLFFASFIYLLARHLHQRWTLAVLVGLQVLWVNMHGFFFFGPLLAGLGIASEAIKRHVPLPAGWKAAGRLTDEEYQRLKVAGLLLVLACLVNPLTFKGAFYPLTVLFQLSGDSKIFFDHIYELQKPITMATLWNQDYVHYKILIVVSAYSFLLNRRRIDISVFLLWLVFLLFSLAAIRNLVFFAFAAYVVFMANTASITSQDILPLSFVNPRFKSINGIVLKVILIMWMLNYGLDASANGYFDFDTYARKSEYWGVSKRIYPYKGVDFLVRNGIKGNFFNDFNSGAYLVGRASPNIKVFMDGRTEVYGPKFFERYKSIWKEGDKKTFDELSRTYNVTGAFLNSSNQEVPKKALRLFYGMKDWHVVYFDDDAIIFLKETPLNKAWIDRFSIDLSKWEPKPMNLMKLGAKYIDPFPFTNRAYTLDAIDLWEPALKELNDALQVRPDFLPAHKLLGKIYGDQNDHQKAFEHLRIAAMYAPRDKQIRSNLALAYQKLKDYPGMEEQYQRIVDLNPDGPEGYFGLSEAYALQGRFNKSLESLKVARKIAPKDKVDVKKIHDIITKRNTNAEITRQLESLTK